MYDVKIDKESCVLPSLSERLMQGYCWTHDLSYKLIESDSVCPKCLNAKKKDLEWRDNEE